MIGDGSRRDFRKATGLDGLTMDASPSALTITGLEASPFSGQRLTSNTVTRIDTAKPPLAP